MGAAFAGYADRRELEKRLEEALEDVRWLTEEHERLTNENRRLREKLGEAG